MNTTYRIKDYSHETTTVPVPITTVETQDLTVEEPIFTQDSLFSMDFQPCFTSQVQDHIDDASEISFGSYEFVEEQNQQYLNSEMVSGHIQSDLLNSNIVSEKDPDWFPDGDNNLFGTYETQPELIDAFTSEKSITIKEQPTITRNFTRHEEIFSGERFSRSINDNFNLTSSDGNYVTLHVIETEDAATTNTIPDLHLTEVIPHFDPVILINDIEIDLGNNTFIPAKNHGWFDEGNKTTMAMDPMWTNPGSDPIPAPHLRLAGCGGSVVKVSGLTQRVRCV